MEAHRILVVDDDYASRLMLKKALENEGYDITLCNNGDEAIKELQKASYDLVITDLIMDGISGIELLSKVKEISTDIAAILLTGHASLETAIEAVRLGASDYLAKPVNLEELQIRVKRALERVELEKRLYEAERKLTYNATIATANHEINQPLTVIISAIDMVKMELERLKITDERLFNYLDLMHKSSMRIANILRKLREITSPKIQEVPLGMKMIEMQEESASSPEQHKRYILVIEDEENLRQIVQDVLESEGYKVIMAQTAEEGVNLYQSNKELIEVVVLDFYLPDADGLEVLGQLMEQNKKVKVLLTSGFDVDDSIRQALQLGAIDFIRKPFNRQQILTAIQKVYTHSPE